MTLVLILPTIKMSVLIGVVLAAMPLLSKRSARLPPQRARRDRGMCTDLAAARTACAVVVLRLARLSGHLLDGDVFLSRHSG